jgi:hypothetical protein
MHESERTAELVKHGLHSDCMLYAIFDVAAKVPFARRLVCKEDWFAKKKMGTYSNRDSYPVANREVDERKI